MFQNYIDNEVSIEKTVESKQKEQGPCNTTPLVLQILLCATDANWNVWMCVLMEVTFHMDKDEG